MDVDKKTNCIVVDFSFDENEIALSQEEKERAVGKKSVVLWNKIKEATGIGENTNIIIINVLGDLDSWHASVLGKIIVSIDEKIDKYNTNTRSNLILAMYSVCSSLPKQVGIKTIEKVTENKDSDKTAIAREAILTRYRSTNFWFRNSKGIQFELFVPYNIDNIGNIDERITVFEGYAEQVLKAPISDFMQKEGYRINGSHARLGNSLDINDFVFAEALLSNGYFQSGFAHLLLRKISKLNKNKNICLVGYDAYSESLTFQVKKLLEGKNFKNVNVIIYDTTPQNGSVLKYLSETLNSIDIQTQFVYIVPTGSTLETFRKMDMKLRGRVAHLYGVHLRKEVSENSSKIALLKKCTQYKGVDTPFLSGKDNYCLFRISCGYDTDSEVVELFHKYNDKVHNFITVESKYFSATNCEKCFPKELSEEMPLLRTRKSSVVPIVQLGIKDKKDEYKESNIFDDSEKINYLVKDVNRPSVLKYDHWELDNNHYQYYIKTDVLFERISSDSIALSKLNEWLYKIKDSIGVQCENVRHLVIAPTNSTNAQFVNHVCSEIFFDKENLVNVLRIDSLKEFRSNFKAKFAPVVERIKSWKKQKLKIFVHYVDDSILSGRTLRRALSLVNSLMSKGDIVLNSVILLLDRMSASSKLNYLSGANGFHSFINLNIPHLRTFEDACPLCELHGVHKKLMMKSASIDVIKHFAKKTEEFASKNFKNHESNLSKYKDSDVLKKQDDENTTRGKSRLVAAHYAHKVLNNCSSTTESIERIKYLIRETQKHFTLIKHKKNNEIEFEIAYIKVLSRPFLNFGFTTKNAIFKYFIKETEKLVDLIIKNHKNGISKQNINYYLSKLKALLSSLSQNGSNFLIRQKSLPKLFKAMYILDRDSKPDEAHLITRLICYIKEVIAKDIHKSAWLGYILVKGLELKNNCDRKNIWIECIESREFDNNFSIEYKNFRWRLYMENTSIFREIIEVLKKHLDRLSSEIEEPSAKASGSTNSIFEVFKKRIALHKEAAEAFNKFKEIFKLNFNIQTEKIDEKAWKIIEQLIVLQKIKREDKGKSICDKLVENVHFLGDSIEDNFVSTVDIVVIEGNKLHSISNRDEKKIEDVLDKCEYEKLFKYGFCVDKNSGYILLDNADYFSGEEKAKGQLISYDGHAKMQQVAIEVKFVESESSDEKMVLKKLFLLRLISCFRYDFIKLLELEFRNDYFLHNAEYLKFKRRLGVGRAIVHADEKEIGEFLDEVKVTDEKAAKHYFLVAHVFRHMQKINKRNVEILTYLLEKKLGNKPIDYPVKSSKPKFEIERVLEHLEKDEKFYGCIASDYEKLYKLYGDVGLNDVKLNIDITDNALEGENLFLIKYMGMRLRLTADFHTLLLHEMILSAYKHGLRKDNAVYINIKKSERYLEFRNKLRDEAKGKELETLEKKLLKICSEEYPGESGVSLSLFWNIFKWIKNYDNALPEVEYYIDRDNRDFVARFPIFKEVNNANG